MAFERRGGRLIYYLSRWLGGKPRRLYIGSGDVGRIAAGIDARHRCERQAQLARWQAEKTRLEAAQALSRELHLACILLMNAVLLTAGFHRRKRESWGRWYAARRLLKTTG